jgi:hypothetical protein
MDAASVPLDRFLFSTVIDAPFFGCPHRSMHHHVFFATAYFVPCLVRAPALGSAASRERDVFAILLESMSHGHIITNLEHCSILLAFMLLSCASTLLVGVGCIK